MILSMFDNRKKKQCYIFTPTLTVSPPPLIIINDWSQQGGWEIMNTVYIASYKLFKEKSESGKTLSVRSKFLLSHVMNLILITHICLDLDSKL